MKPVLFLSGWLCIATAFGATCVDDRNDFANLPSEVGVEGRQEKTPYPLQCDTVTVPRNSTTVVHAGSMLYFSRENPSNLIRVQGTLILRGVKESYVTLEGGHDSVKTSREPSTVVWSGILVDSGGRLEMEFAGFYGAGIPIVTNSPQVKIVNSFFTGGKGLIRPDGSWYLLDSQFTAVNLLDFSKAQPKAQASDSSLSPHTPELDAKEKAALLAEKNGGFWSSPKTWIAVGGGAVLVGGGYYFLFPTKSTTAAVPVNPTMDTKPQPP